MNFPDHGGDPDLFLFTFLPFYKPSSVTTRPHPGCFCRCFFSVLKLCLLKFIYHRMVWDLFGEFFFSPLVRSLRLLTASLPVFLIANSFLPMLNIITIIWSWPRILPFFNITSLSYLTIAIEANQNWFWESTIITIHWPSVFTHKRDVVINSQGTAFQPIDSKMPLFPISVKPHICLFQWEKILRAWSLWALLKTFSFWSFF